MKTCPKCLTRKEETEFYSCSVTKKNPRGLSAYCRSCQTKKNKEYYSQHRSREKKRSKRWKQQHPEKYREQYHLQNERDKDKQREWREAHREHRIKQRKEWYRDNSSYNKEYYQNNKEQIRKAKAEYDKKKRARDPVYKLNRLLRTRLYHALKGQARNGSAVRDMGCTVEELKVYLESKWEPGMSWENWGYHGWHIDHIKPLGSFNLTNREELLEACHYTNLRPLWAKDNLKKK